MQLPIPRQQGTHGSALGHGAIGALPASYPTPLSRLIFRDLKLLITLNEEEERSSESGETGVLPEVQQLSCVFVATTYNTVWVSCCLPLLLFVYCHLGDIYTTSLGMGQMHACKERG